MSALTILSILKKSDRIRCNIWILHRKQRKISPILCFRINKSMRFNQIREIVVKNGYDKATIRQAWLTWLGDNSSSGRFDVGLTITAKKIFYKRVANRSGDGGKNIYRQLSKTELERANTRLVELLNKLVYKEGYKRFGKRLDVVAVVEGERELIDLHTHMAIKRPAEMQTNEFARRVLKALQISGEFVIENERYKADKDCVADRYCYKLDIIDSGWLSYITKKLNGKDFDNLYLL